MHVDYKKSRIKQYHKEGEALRTETTINDTRDFGIGRGTENLAELRKIGFAANRRLLHVQCRWFPSDDLDDNAAMLRALRFNVQVHDVERDAHPLREIERREGTKRLLTAQKILKSLINGQVIEGPSPGAVAFLVVAIGISIKQDGRRMIAGSVGLESP